MFRIEIALQIIQFDVWIETEALSYPKGENDGERKLSKFQINTK